MATRTLALAVVVFLGAHAALGSLFRDERPNLGLMPPLPSIKAIDAMAFGDRQLLYRTFVLEVQNAGDTGGRFTPMSQYRADQVLPWLGVLQQLDVRSQLYPFLAWRYFSRNWSSEELAELIAFTEHDVALAPDRKWFWQTQAVTLAQHKLADTHLALRLSRKLRSFAPYLPSGFMWVVQMEPILLAELGRNEEARKLILEQQQNLASQMTDAERNWTREFIEKLK